VQLSLVLGDKAVETARAGAADHPGQALFTYYLAHALLSDVGIAKDPTPGMLAHRTEIRDEARALLEGVLGDPAYGARAARHLEVLRRETEPDETEPDAPKPDKEQPGAE
jgi:hypothetical protein